MAKSNLYPLTIIADRYTGSYSGGAWLAFQIGVGECPDEALRDLEKKVME